MEVCNDFKKGYKNLCGFCGHALEIHGPKMTAEQFVHEETARLRKFEEYWEKEMRHRSPDEKPAGASLTNAVVWRERYEEFLNEEIR